MWILGGLLLCGVLVALLQVFSDPGQTTPTPSPAPVRIRTEIPLPPLAIEGLPIPEQVALLRRETVQLAQRLVEQFPQQAQAHLLLGNTYRQVGQSDQARESWHYALRLEPRRADVFDNLALLAMEKGLFDEALTYWEKVQTLEPSYSGIRTNIGRMLVLSNRLDEAISVLQESAEQGSASVQTHYFLGQAYLHKRDYATAVPCYRQAMALDPNAPNPHYGLFTALVRLGRVQEAKPYQSTFKKLLSQSGGERPYGATAADDLNKAKQSYVTLATDASLFYRKSRRQPMAGALLEQALTLDPNCLDAHRKLAAHYQFTNQFPQALAQCEHIARLTPADPVCHMLLGTLALRLKRPARAEAAFRRMIDLTPSQSAGYQKLTQLYLQTGKNLSAAQALMKKAVAMDPSAGNHYLLGLTYHRTGDTEKARSALQSAMTLAPTNKTYRKTFNQLYAGP